MSTLLESLQRRLGGNVHVHVRADGTRSYVATLTPGEARRLCDALAPAFDLDAEIERVAAAIRSSSRHLSAHRMAWAAGRVTPEKEWRGCNKGQISRGVAKQIVTGGSGGQGAPVPAERLQRVTLEFRAQPGTQGQYGLTPEDVPELERRREVAADQGRPRAAARLERAVLWVRGPSPFS